MKKLVDAPEDGVELELFRGVVADLYNPQVDLDSCFRLTKHARE